LIARCLHLPPEERELLFSVGSWFVKEPMEWKL
jgi:hypothetical protein